MKNEWRSFQLMKVDLLKLVRRKNEGSLLSPPSCVLVQVHSDPDGHVCSNRGRVNSKKQDRRKRRKRERERTTGVDGFCAFASCQARRNKATFFSRRVLFSHAFCFCLTCYSPFSLRLLLLLLLLLTYNPDVVSDDITVFAAPPARITTSTTKTTSALQ